MAECNGDSSPLASCIVDQCVHVMLLLGPNGRSPHSWLKRPSKCFSLKLSGVGNTQREKCSPFQPLSSFSGNDSAQQHGQAARAEKRTTHRISQRVVFQPRAGTSNSCSIASASLLARPSQRWCILCAATHKGLPLWCLLLGSLSSELVVAACCVWRNVCSVAIVLRSEHP